MSAALRPLTDEIEAAALDYDFFADDKDNAGIRCHRVSIVTTRTLHECLISPERRHAIPPGSRARRDEAIFDGKWCSFYTCVECLAAEVAALEGRSGAL